MYNVRPYMSPCCCWHMPLPTGHSPMPYPHPNSNHFMTIQDYGNQPFVVNINEASQQNQTFRTVLWTGEHLQVTVMSIPPGGDVGLEVHPETDQFLRIERGRPGSDGFE